MTGKLLLLIACFVALTVAAEHSQLFPDGLCYPSYDFFPPDVKIKAGQMALETCAAMRSQGSACFAACKEFHLASSLPVCVSELDLTPLPVCESTCLAYQSACGLSEDFCASSSSSPSSRSCAAGPYAGVQRQQVPEHIQEEEKQKVAELEQMLDYFLAHNQVSAEELMQVLAAQATPTPPCSTFVTLSQSKFLSAFDWSQIPQNSTRVKACLGDICQTANVNTTFTCLVVKGKNPVAAPCSINNFPLCAFQQYWNFQCRTVECCASANNVLYVMLRRVYNQAGENLLTRFYRSGQEIPCTDYQSYVGDQCIQQLQLLVSSDWPACGELQDIYQGAGVNLADDMAFKLF